ncbi:MAG: hypothetical protein Q4D41_00870 [Prevotellaceae bacterium]|nr:hypothetical protein [Prevotellaceae bacterium]
MNIKMINKFLLALLAIVSLCSCSNELDIVSDITDDSAAADTNSGFYFTVPSETRLTYSGSSTTFSSGDTIGCVIATKTNDTYTYTANTQWIYKSGALVLNKMWTESNGTTSQITLDSNPYLETDNKGYIKVNSADPIYFFFYYPYIDSDVLGNENMNVNIPTNSSDSYLMGQVASSSSVTINNSEGTATSYTPYSWTEYPIFVNTNQSTQWLHSIGDFLYASYTNSDEGISSNNVPTTSCSLNFAKKTATVRVVSSTALSDVKMTAGATGIVVGQKIDLSTGTLNAYTETSGDYLLVDNIDITPYKVSEKEYRFVLPEQDFSTLEPTLSFSYSKASSDGSTTENVSASQGLSNFGSLSAGKIYTYTIKQKPITCYFDEDGVVASESGVFEITAGRTTTNDNNIGPIINGTQYNYYLNLNSSARLKLTITQTMDVTLYFGKAESGRSTRATITNSSNESTVYGIGLNGGTGSDDTSTDVASYLTFRLDAGEYVLSQGTSSPKRCLFYISLDYITE